MLLFSTAICRLTFVVQSLWTIGLVWGDEMSYTDQESESTGSWGMKINDTIDKEVSTADVLQIRGGNTTYENVLRGYGLKLKQSDFDGMSGERLGPSHRSNRSHKSFSQGSDRTHTEVLGNSTRSPYEISPRFHGRKLLAKSESSPDLDSAAKEIAANPIQTDPIAKKINEKNEQIKKEKEAGPEIYIDKWPALRHKMADLKKKILAARKKLDDPVNKLLERIDEGDELQKQASHISNLQRLDHLGKSSNSKTIKALKDSYKDLYSAISNITGAFEKMEDSLTGSSVNVGVQKLEHELRTLMQFETAQVETAIDSGWSAITNSLAGTTNFQYSVLKDTPKAPVFSIYRYGDGHGEKTNLREELKNMQTSIDSLSYESQDATDPDLQRVDQVLRDMLGKSRLTSEIESENSIDKINGIAPVKSTFDKNDLYFGVDHHQNANVGEETSDLKDGIFYLFESQDRPENILHKKKDDSDTEFDIDLAPGAVTDAMNGGVFPAPQSPVDFNDVFGSYHGNYAERGAQREKQEMATDHIMNGNADVGMKTVDGHSIDDVKHHFPRKTRSVHDIKRKCQRIRRSLNHIKRNLYRRTRFVENTKWNFSRKTRSAGNKKGNSQTMTISVDGIKRNSQTMMRSVDGIKRNSQTMARSVDGMKRSSQTMTRTVDGIKRSSQAMAQSVDGIKRSSQTMAKSVDGIKRISNTMTRSVDGIKRNSQTMTRSIDDIKRNSQTMTRSADGIKRNSHTMMRSVDGIKRNSHTMTRSVYGIKRNFQTMTRSVDGIKRSSQTMTRPVGGIKRNSHTMTRSVDSIKHNSQKMTKSVESIKRSSHTMTRSIDGIKRNSQTMTRSVDGIKRKIRLRKRSAFDPEDYRRRNKNVIKGNVISGNAITGDEDATSVQRDVNTVVNLPSMGGDKPPKRHMFKSKEDDESFNNVDVERKQLDKMELPNLSPYNQEDEVDETGEEGSEVYFAKSYLPVDSYDNVPLKDSLTESVDKYSDAEFEDDSMGTSRVNTYDSDLQDINFHADSDLVKNYKTSLNLRHFLPETLQPTDPKFGRIEDGLAGDVRLGPGELVDEEDNPIYAPDRNYPLTGPNAGPEVGSLAFWSKEIRKLDESDKRNQILASKLRREFIGEEEPGDLPVNGDIVFPDAGEKGGEHSLPRVSDLFSEQVRSIIRDTQGKDNTVKSDRKQLPPWMKDFSFGADVSDESELERRREDELARLINPGIDVLLKRAEKKYAHQKPTGQDFKDVNKIVLSLLDDVPVNPDEFEYQKGLADVSVYTKPVDSNPATLEDRKPKDELALKAIEGLDNAAKTLEKIQEDMKARQREKLKSELKDAENVRREMKIHEEKKRMEDMLGHIKAIPKMEAVAKDLGKKRVQQYKHLMNSLRQAYGERVKNQKKNLKTYNKLSKKMEKIQEEVDDIASESEPIT